MAQGKRRKKALALSKKAMNYRIVRFLVSGGIATGVDIVAYYITLFYILEQRDLPIFNSLISAPVASLCISYSCGFITSFLINKFFVFTTSTMRTRIQLIRFTVVAALAFVGHYLALKFFVEFVQIDPLSSRILAVIIVAFLNYQLHKFFTFKVKNIQSNETA